MIAKQLRRRPGLKTQTADPVESAKVAGLCYVTDSCPGISHKRAGKDFTYINVDGSAILRRYTVQQAASVVPCPVTYKRQDIQPGESQPCSLP
jgi:DNA topoisomerase IB